VVQFLLIFPPTGCKYLLIKYVKTDKARKPFYVNDEKKVTQRDDTVFFIVPIIREGSVLKTLLTMGKLKG
jgi:hypothetical protein